MSACMSASSIFGCLPASRVMKHQVIAVRQRASPMMAGNFVEAAATSRLSACCPGARGRASHVARTSSLGPSLHCVQSRSPDHRPGKRGRANRGGARSKGGLPCLPRRSSIIDPGVFSTPVPSQAESRDELTLQRYNFFSRLLRTCYQRTHSAPHATHPELRASHSVVPRVCGGRTPH